MLLKVRNPKTLSCLQIPELLLIPLEVWRLLPLLLMQQHLMMSTLLCKSLFLPQLHIVQTLLLLLQAYGLDWCLSERDTTWFGSHHMSSSQGYALRHEEELRFSISSAEARGLWAEPLCV